MERSGVEQVPGFKNTTLLERNHKLFKEDINDSWLAFDFFITANHLLDWYYPADANNKKKTRKQKRNINRLKNKHVILQIVNHIANGAKHFVVTNEHNQSVESIESGKIKFFKPIDEKGRLTATNPKTGLRINLDREAKHKYGKYIYAHDLADKLIEFWKKQLADK